VSNDKNILEKYEINIHNNSDIVIGMGMCAGY